MADTKRDRSEKPEAVIEKVAPTAMAYSLTDNLAAGQTVSDSGLAAFSVAGQDGWTLTDWFENIYVRSAGSDMYEQLAKHEIPWTDQSVKDALAEMAKVVKGGRRFAFSALVVVGNENGWVGYGYGKAREVPEAIRKGHDQARKNMFKVPMIGKVEADLKKFAASSPVANPGNLTES